MALQGQADPARVLNILNILNIQGRQAGNTVLTRSVTSITTDRDI
jgi:hypothetical protein